MQWRVHLTNRDEHRSLIVRLQRLQRRQLLYLALGLYLNVNGCKLLLVMKGVSRQCAAAAAKSTKTKSNPKQQKPPASTRNKSKAPSQPATTGKGKGKGKTTRTYGRASAVTASDKENENEASSEGEEGEANTSLSMREVAHSKELEEARRKFAEVDDWDLTFESMSNEDHRSSSQGWR